MKRIYLLAFSLFATTTLLLAQTTIKDANAEVRAAKNFNVIRLSSAFDVYLTQGNEESVAVSASDKSVLADIKVEVEDGVLSIGYKTRNGKWMRGNQKLKAYISFKTLNKLTAGGACDVDIVGTWKAGDIKLDLSGATDLSGKIIADKIDLDISGASDIKVSGTVGQIRIDASGASSFKGYDMVAEFCDIKASGASGVKLTVNKEINANASGASDIHYNGNGMIRDIKTSGASTIKRNS